MTTIDRAEREIHIAAFLKAAGWAAAERGLLAGDASFRRYDRLKLAGRNAVLMDAPPPMENVGPFLAIARLLHGLGFSVPEVMVEDREHGLLLLEDLGDDTYTRLLQRGHDERALYELATDGPGFTVDGPLPELGTKVILPPFLEPYRDQIEPRLTPLDDPRTDWPADALARAAAIHASHTEPQA